MMEWVEAGTIEETADGSFFSSSQTCAELCSNVTLFICLRISDCQIASSLGFTVGSLGSSMF